MCTRKNNVLIIINYQYYYEYLKTTYYSSNNDAHIMTINYNILINISFSKTNWTLKKIIAKSEKKRLTKMKTDARMKTDENELKFLSLT